MRNQRDDPTESRKDFNRSSSLKLPKIDSSPKTRYPSRGNTYHGASPNSHQSLFTPDRNRTGKAQEDLITLPSLFQEISAKSAPYSVGKGHLNRSSKMSSFAYLTDSGFHDDDGKDENDLNILRQNNDTEENEQAIVRKSEQNTEREDFVHSPTQNRDTSSKSENEGNDTKPQKSTLNLISCENQMLRNSNLQENQTKVDGEKELHTPHHSICENKPDIKKVLRQKRLFSLDDSPEQQVDPAEISKSVAKCNEWLAKWFTVSGTPRENTKESL